MVKRFKPLSRAAAFPFSVSSMHRQRPASILVHPYRDPRVNPYIRFCLFLVQSLWFALVRFSVALCCCVWCDRVIQHSNNDPFSIAPEQHVEPLKICFFTTLRSVTHTDIKAIVVTMSAVRSSTSSWTSVATAVVACAGVALFAGARIRRKKAIAKAVDESPW